MGKVRSNARKRPLLFSRWDNLLCGNYILEFQNANHPARIAQHKRVLYVLRRNQLRRRRPDCYHRRGLYLRDLPQSGCWFLWFIKSFYGLHKASIVIPSVARFFNRVWGSKVCSPHVGHTLAVAPIQNLPSSAYRIDSKKILRPGE